MILAPEFIRGVWCFRLHPIAVLKPGICAATLTSI